MSAVDAIPLLLGSDNYQIQRSLRLRASATAYLSRTFGAGSQTTWTFSAWVKRGALGQQNIMQTGGVGGSLLYFGSGDNIRLSLSIGAAETFNTTAVYRDPSAWFHIQIAVDTTQATAADRAKLYINGTQVTAFSSTNYPALNATFAFNSAASHTFGQSTAQLSGFADLYLAEFNWVGGQALTPSSFGLTDPTTGVWTAKRYSGTYGTNGFYLPFTDNTALTTASNVGIGKDFSGNGNYWVTNNVSITAGATYDSMLDVPLAYGTTDRGNYATLNPALPAVGAITNGNLQNYSSVATIFSAAATQSVSSGKWYWEVTPTAIVTGTFYYPWVGAYRGNLPNSMTGAARPGADVNGFCIRQDGNIYVDGVQPVNYGSFAANDVLGFALDLSAMQISFYKNGTLLGTRTGLAADTYTVGNSDYNGSTSVYNFGQRPFTYTPPTGFKALHTGNLPAATILKPNKHFDVLTHAGNSGTQNVTGLQFQPDMAWIKNRSVVADHQVYDVIRGSTLSLQTNTTNADQTYGIFGGFLSNGIQVIFNSLQGTNQTGSNYVDWLWKAGGAAVTNTAGSISAQVSANASAGFSIVTYTGNGTAGATFGHGLGVTPKMVIIKNRSTGTTDWVVNHTGLGGNGNSIYLNLTAPVSTNVVFFNSTNPNSSVVTIGTNTSVNGNTNTFVAYCFAEIAGYSKFGSYTGNGSADGPFVYCGFRPRWIMIKNATAASQWRVIDTARSTSNLSTLSLRANASNAEDSTGVDVDITSNGFKVRIGVSTDLNDSGSSYIFAAFAESPFQYSLAR